ncbi:glycosyltransferase [Luteolibacter luteus]|uniref:Glycosyltransferase family 4 protein n=1 Tax=Luteolibacter luteus TaxID=2728835 RepID=A0A858RJ84_9BACT|nr:glycosyltransferase [Luteolibacter luteus]QJE96977.1 glycosyltransferase family 4 protein [Luteolibacter luteus]
MNPPSFKVLQVFNQYLEAGGEEVWVNQLPAFAEEALEVRDLRFHSGTWKGSGAPSRFSQAIKVWNNPESRERLRKVVAETSPQVLLFHNLLPVGSLGLYDEATQLGLPVVQYIHNFRPFSPSGTMWVRGRVHDGALHGNPWPEVFGRAWERSFMRTFLVATYQSKLVGSGTLDVVKRWLAVSNFMRDKFISAGIPPERVVTLRHCWRPRAEHNASPMAGHYLFLGRLVPEKGLYTMLEAWRILEKRLGNACPRLVIAGTGPDEAKVHALTTRMKKVVCVGFVSGKQKDSLIYGCRALIAPSIWWEPLGLIVYEAFDFMRPVLAAASGGLTETVTEGVTGFLHPPGDAARLADDVERMEELGMEGRTAMGRAGREWLLQNASQSQWLAEFSRILRDAAEQ